MKTMSKIGLVSSHLDRLQLQFSLLVIQDLKSALEVNLGRSELPFKYFRSFEGHTENEENLKRIIQKRTNSSVP